MGHSNADQREALPQGTPEWITPELVELTIRVWQKHYKQALTIHDAIAILQGAGHLIDVLRCPGAHAALPRGLSS